MATRAVRARMAAETCAVILLLLNGCASPLLPFVLEAGEYQPDLRSATKIATVEVCYNRWTTTPEAVKQLAKDVCVRKGKYAEFAKHRILQCTALLPMNAIFECR